jgi:hypothetical protein
MMKTIEEALGEHIRSMQEGGCIPNYEEDDFNAGNQYGFEQGFLAGVEFSQRWISVDEELPPVSNTDILIKGINLEGHEGVCDIGYMHAPGKSAENIISLSSEIMEVTHWRPIEQI